MGFEPTTSGITIRDSNQLSYVHHIVIVQRRVAEAAVGYRRQAGLPCCRNHSRIVPPYCLLPHPCLLRHPRMARPAGIEPATLGLEGRCSIRLSYERTTCRCCKPGNPGRSVTCPSACSGSGRGRGIRTPDTLLPKQVRYQTALYPVLHCSTHAECGGRDLTYA